MTNQSKPLLLPLALLISLASAKEADAAPGGCSLTVTPLNFGTYDVFSVTDLTSTATITVRCTTGSYPGNVTVTLGLGAAPSFLARRMIKVAEELDFQIYTDAARTTIWGDATGGTQSVVVAVLAKNTNYPVTAYGLIPALQDVSAGAYAETILATVNW